MEDFKNGFIKLNRGFFNNFLWNEAREFSKAEAWIDLIQSARFEASTEIINGKVIELQKGELPASRRFLELRWNWGSSKVSNFLKTLANLNMINQRQTNGQTIIILVKYSFYNDVKPPNKPPGEPTGNQRQTSSEPTANQNKEHKEVKEGKEGKEENSNLIIPQMLSAWLEVFPNYAGYQVNDFPALKEILDFMIEQKDVGHDIENSENIEKAKSKMRTIAMNVKADKFYNGKSLDTIRKKVQEFYTSKQISESKSIKNSFDLEVQKILEREKSRSQRVQ